MAIITDELSTSNQGSGDQTKKKRVVKVRVKKSASAVAAGDLSGDPPRIIVRRKASSVKNERPPSVKNERVSKYSREDSTLDGDEDIDNDETFSEDGPLPVIEVLMQNGEILGTSSHHRNSGTEEEDNRSFNSAKSNKSTKSELDDVAHRSSSKHLSSSITRCRSPSKKKSSNSPPPEQRISLDFQKIAKEAHKRRKEREKEEDGYSSAGTNKSGATNKSTRSTKSTASQRAMKDSLHNLLMKKKSNKSENYDEDDDEDLRPGTPPPAPPSSGSFDLSPQRCSPKRRLSKEESVRRRQLVYSWYNRLGGPTREAFRRRITSGEMSDDGLEAEDVNLLPWIHNGQMINLTEMNKIFIMDK